MIVRPCLFSLFIFLSAEAFHCDIKPAFFGKSADLPQDESSLPAHRKNVSFGKLSIGLEAFAAIEADPSGRNQF